MQNDKETKNQEAKDKVLLEAIQKDRVREALAELIVTRNLPYKATT